MSKLSELHDGNFESVTRATVPILVEFGAQWCAPCRTMLPVLEKLAEDLSESVLVCKVDIDESPHVTSKYGVRSVPTFVVLKDGEETARMVGAVPYDKLKVLLTK